MRFFSTLLLCVLCATAMAQQSPEPNYQLAARFAPTKLNKLIFSTVVDPHWLKNGDRFWYEWKSPEGTTWWLVDAARAQKKPLFDNVKMAAELTRIVKDPFDAQHLPIDSLIFIGDETKVQFEIKSSQEIERRDTTKKDAKPLKERKIFYFEYNLNTGQLRELADYKKPKRKPGWATISPDGQTILFARRYNLYQMDRANYEKALQNEDDSTIVEQQLTTDGVEFFSYGDGFNENNIDREKNKNKRRGIAAYWSPDSKHFAIIRNDNRKVKDLWVINSISEPRPTLETYKYHMPGEKDGPVPQLLLFNRETKERHELDVKQFKDQAINLWSAPQKESSRDDPYRPLLWQGTGDKFYFGRTSRDLKRIDLCLVDITTGKVQPLIREEMNTYVETRRPGIINGGSELIQWSERDGWAHFYLHDGAGKLKNQITSGAWHCEDIVAIDEKARVLYFSANGREEKEDPYYLHLYRVNFDGTGLRLLNPGEAEHDMSMSDSRNYFIDNFSRVSSTPKSVLYNNEGRKIMDLETADLSALFAAGYKFPEVFKVKADDGVTDLYGVMYKPFNFDSTKKYPVIEYVYPGPQTEAVNKAFGRSMDRVDRLAQVGFIVITVGNRGGHPSRSKWYHNFGYGNLRDYGLADKKAAVEQLADRYPFIDINRVGIHGHSGGGFMSTAAMLVYPNFFKVAVSSAGNHDNSIYNRWWSEKHHGVKEVVGEKGDTTFLYTIDKNPELAKNLKGHLMLVHGDVDNNVHPANTIRVANALIKANKRFDLVILPGQRHAFGNMTEYFFWRMADYFSEHLLGKKDFPVNIEEMDREMELKK